MPYRYFASAFAIGLALTGAANAAEVQRRAEIRGDKDKIWAAFGDWCGIADWHPAIAKCDEREMGGAKIRTLTTKDGGIIKETLLSSEPLAYSYRIDESPLPVANYTATFSMADAADEDGTMVVWSAKFDPKGASEEEAKTVIEAIFTAGLLGIAEKVK